MLVFSPTAASVHSPGAAWAARVAAAAALGTSSLGPGSDVFPARLLSS